MEKILYQPKYFPVLNNQCLNYSSGDTQQRFNCFITMSEYHRSFQENQNLDIANATQLIDLSSVIFDNYFGERNHHRRTRAHAGRCLVLFFDVTLKSFNSTQDAWWKQVYPFCVIAQPVFTFLQKAFFLLSTILHP